MKQSGKRYHRKPTDDGEFLWLVSLSDLMILLFVTFVVLFAFTYKKLKDAGLLNPQEFMRMVAALQNKKLPPNPIEQVQKDLNQWVKDQKLSDQIAIERKGDSLIMQMKDKVLFQSGEFALHPIGLAALRSLVEVIKKIPEPYRIGIEGHTDDIPIFTKQIRDNWDLSAKRAIAVLHALEMPELLLKRTVVMAHADTEPLVPHRTPDGKPIPENQSRNRRVTLKIF